jgi:hypothetical protein
MTIGLPAPRQAATTPTSPCLGLTPDEPLVSSRTQAIPFSRKPCLPVLAGHRAVANGCPVFRGTQVLKVVLHVAALLHAHNLLDVLTETRDDAVTALLLFLRPAFVPCTFLAGSNIAALPSSSCGLLSSTKATHTRCSTLCVSQAATFFHVALVVEMPGRPQQATPPWTVSS